MKKKLVLIIMLFSVNFLFGVEASKKERVVVLPFKDLSQQESYNPGEKLSSTLAGDLAALGRFQVLDRTELESILEEQKLTLSGAVENDQGIKVGKLASAKMAFTGNIASLNVYREEEVKDKVADLGILKIKKEERTYKKEWNAKLKVTIKVLNVETGEIIKSFTKEVTYETQDVHNEESAIDGAIDKISDDIINGMRELFLIKSYIIDKQGKTAIIRLGTNMGIKKGMEFYIYSDGNKIKDKYSGKILDVSGENIGLLYITDVDKNSAYAKIVRGKSEVKSGQKLK
ncbi:MAG: CsgG/HfaB family protein, partial [Fusobacteriota bacterium]